MQKKSIVLADCDELEIKDMVDSLNTDKYTFEIHSHISNWKRTNTLSEIRRYVKYFSVAFVYFLKRRKYQMIVGWQQFYALIFCFFCWLFRTKKTFKVVVLNFTFKEKNGIMGRIYRWFMRKCVLPEYLDFLHVLSNEYAEHIARVFSFPRDRIIVTAFGVKDRFSDLSRLEAPNGYRKDEYALAIGRSNRDYDFLIRAWKKIEYPLVIIDDTYNKITTNRNIIICNDIAGEESYRWIANCGLMIIPIDDGSICSGDTVLLTAMSLRRKIIVTIPSTLSEMYVESGVNAIVAEKNVDLFSNIVKQALFSENYSHLGECARRRYLEMYTTSAMGRAISNAIFCECSK